MLINLSNHPSSKWSETQIAAAHSLFGEIVDMPFPAVAPDGDEKYIADLADEYCDKVMEVSGGEPAVVHLMGEMNLTFILVSLLQNEGYTCIASTTRRIVRELPDGGKEAKFQFVRFRKYKQQ